MRAFVLWLLMLGPSLAEVSLDPLRNDLAAIYEARQDKAKLALTFDPVLPYVELPGPVRIYKTPKGYQAADMSGHRPALCTVKFTMVMRALSETCRGLARPDQVRVMDLTLDRHIAFIAENSLPPRPVAEVRRAMAFMMSDAYQTYDNPRACGDPTMMGYLTAYLAEIERGEVQTQLDRSLAAPRLPVEQTCS